LRRPGNHLLANFGLWALTYGIVTARALSSDMPMPHQEDMALRRLVMCVGGFLACLAISPVLAWLSKRPVWARLVASLAFSAAGGFAYAGLNYVVFYMIYPRWPVEPLSAMSTFWMASSFFWTFLAWCVVYFAIRAEEELREKSMRLVSAQALAADAQNRMLRYQINPHFLFNTLNALSSLILAKETERAERVVLSLSSFLRYTLEKDVPDKARLSEEIEAQRQYLLIEQARFEDRLVIEEKVPKELGGALVPSLILQPLIENAVKYGVARSSEPVTVQIAAEASVAQLRLTVSDDGKNGGGAEPPRLGVGLQNVRRRLEVLYGRAARLRCERRNPHGFLATIEIPLETA
jgi:two-component system, LytTR family, sensor kinase